MVSPFRLLAAAVLLVLPAAAAAQGFSFPERASNLQVLPADTDADRLRTVMQSFTRALGVRCSHCHVGPEGASLAEMDFASDDLPAKRTARLMMRMTRTVNGDFLASLESRTEGLQVTCETCHRGAPRPLGLADELMEAYRRGGIEAAVSRHKLLLERYEGGFTYDFRPPSLDRFATRLADEGHGADAATFYRFVLERYPEYGPAHVGLGNLALAAGDSTAARSAYEAALRIDPRDRMASRALERLGPARH